MDLVISAKNNREVGISNLDRAINLCRILDRLNYNLEFGDTGTWFEDVFADIIVLDVKPKDETIIRLAIGPKWRLSWI